ncbi:MAG: hypothetical protein ACI35O_12100 [Bacillaceae bacterium]
MKIFVIILVVSCFISFYKGHYLDKKRKMSYIMTMLMFIPFLATWMLTLTMHNFSIALILSMLISVGIAIIFLIDNSEKMLESSGMALMSGVMGSMLVPMIPNNMIEMVNQFVLFLFTSLIILTILSIFLKQMMATRKRMILFTSISITIIVVLFVLSLNVQSSIHHPYMHM